MKLNEVKEFVGYYVNIFRENPAMLADVVGWEGKEGVKEKLKEASRVLDDPSQRQEVQQLINTGDALFNKAGRGLVGE